MTENSGKVASRVRLAAIALFAVGIVDVALAILVIVSGFFTGSFDLGPHEGVIGVLALAASGVILAGAWGMGRGRVRRLALAASVLAMIPCLSLCFMVGLPVGIWSLVVLSDPDVKSDFR